MLSNSTIAKYENDFAVDIDDGIEYLKHNNFSNAGNCFRDAVLVANLATMHNTFNSEYWEINKAVAILFRVRAERLLTYKDSWLNDTDLLIFKHTPSEE